MKLPRLKLPSNNSPRLRTRPIQSRQACFNPANFQDIPYYRRSCWVSYKRRQQGAIDTTQTISNKTTIETIKHDTMHQDSAIQDNDVLCGRGGATNNHVGNKRYRALVSDHQQEYLIAKKKDKATIAREIVRLVRDRGGRFLRKDAARPDMWVEVGDKKATEKTSQALREGLDVRHKEFRGKSKKAPRRDSDSSSEQPKKRRRVGGTTVSGKVMTMMMQGSPALVSESGSPSVPPLQEEERVNIPYFIYHPTKISETDCDHVETV